jgi:hypothetical protein
MFRYQNLALARISILALSCQHPHLPIMLHSYNLPNNQFHTPIYFRKTIPGLTGSVKPELRKLPRNSVVSGGPIMLAEELGWVPSRYSHLILSQNSFSRSLQFGPVNMLSKVPLSLSNHLTHGFFFLSLASSTSATKVAICAISSFGTK